MQAPRGHTPALESTTHKNHYSVDHYVVVIVLRSKEGAHCSSSFPRVPDPQCLHPLTYELTSTLPHLWRMGRSRPCAYCIHTSFTNASPRHSFASALTDESLDPSRRLTWSVKIARTALLSLERTGLRRGEERKEDPTPSPRIPKESTSRWPPRHQRRQRQWTSMRAAPHPLLLPLSFL
jgi:hypothetical protein